jgi:glycosyltransferase involved in cell wall biosynthesis
LPSVSEPFGLTPLEAGFYGVPSLISKQSGVSEVLRSALKVDFWDINEMANQIVGALRSQSIRDVLKEELDKELMSVGWDQPAGQIKHLYERHLSGVAV